MTIRITLSCIFCAVILAMLAPSASAGDADPLQKLHPETKNFTLAGRDAWRQLLVSGQHASGKTLHRMGMITAGG